MESGTSAERAGTLDIKRITNATWRYLIPVGILAILIAGFTVLSSRRSPAVYQASSSMVALRSDSGNNVVNNALVTAAVLPTGALQEALSSPEVTRDIRNRLPALHLGTAEEQDLQRRLDQNAAADGPRSLRLVSRLDEQRTGVYEVLARASTPEAARGFADATVAALMAWDTRRSTDSVTRARQSVERRITSLDASLRSSPNSVDRAELLNLRSELVRDREQLRVLEQAALGSLTRVGSARLPTEPVSPTPLRDGLVAALMAMMLGLPLAVVLDLARRRVQLVEDLAALDVPLLAVMPRLSRQVLGSGLSAALKYTQVQQQASALRVGVWARLPGQQLRVLMVSGLSRGDGATTVSALLASALSEWGSRVLLVDADPLRADQARIWRTRTDGAGHPVTVAPRIDLWRQPALSRFTVETQKFELLQEEWRRQYDFVILDCPPVTEVADSLLLMPHAAGVLFVTSPGTAHLDETQRTLERARQMAANVIGFVMNRGRTGGRGRVRSGALPLPGRARSESPSLEVAPVEVMSRRS